MYIEYSNFRNSTLKPKSDGAQYHCEHKGQQTRYFDNSRQLWYHILSVQQNKPFTLIKSYLSDPTSKKPQKPAKIHQNDQI